LNESELEVRAENRQLRNEIAAVRAELEAVQQHDSEKADLINEMAVELAELRKRV